MQDPCASLAQMLEPAHSQDLEAFKGGEVSILSSIVRLSSYHIATFHKMRCETLVMREKGKRCCHYLEPISSTIRIEDMINQLLPKIISLLLV